MDWIGSIGNIFAMIVGIIAVAVGGIVLVIRVYGAERRQMQTEHAKERKEMFERYDEQTKETHRLVERNTEAFNSLSVEMSKFSDKLDSIVGG